MYVKNFSFNEKPFSIAPDPRYLYMSPQHEEALAHLLYGLQGEGGIVLLTGEVGTGKTTMVRKVLEDLPESTHIAWIINPKLSNQELLSSICDELGIPHLEQSIKTLTSLITNFLLENHARGHNTVLMIDEAQNLSADALEQLRLLTNLETNERKLLQIVLIGQPELQDMLDRHDLRQFSQRITARFHLQPLKKDETTAYIQHRLHIAGSSTPVFSKCMTHKVHQLSAGIPRLINLICDRALLGCYAQEQTLIRNAHIQQAYIEVSGHKTIRPFHIRSALVYAALLATFALVTTQLWQSKSPPTPIKPAIAVQKNSVIKSPEIKANVWDEIARISTQDLSFQTLANAWSLSFSPEEKMSFCQQLAAQHHPCLRIKSNLAQLRDLDRPALIRLSSEQGADYTAVITGLKGSQATLSLGDKSWSVSTQALESYWYADFTILWHAPKDFNGPVRRHTTGDIITQITAMLDKVQGQMIPPQKKDYMTPILIERIKTFQRSVGLTPDGTAGTNTFIQLNNAMALPRPHLNQVEG